MSFDAHWVPIGRRGRGSVGGCGRGRRLEVCEPRVCCSVPGGPVLPGSPPPKVPSQPPCCLFSRDWDREPSLQSLEQSPAMQTTAWCWVSPTPGFGDSPSGRGTPLWPLPGGAQGCWPRARPRLEDGLQRAGAGGQQACRLGRVTSHSPRVEKGVQRASEGAPQ